MLRLSLVLLAFMVCTVPWSPSRAQDTAVTRPEVAVPNFWDPRSRLERPTSAEIGALRFLTADDFPPFAFKDRRGILIGFDIDLARAICTVLKVQCAIQTRPFATLLDGLKDGTGNVIIAGFDVEKAGAEGFISSQAYLKIPGRFVVRDDKLFDPVDTKQEGFVGVICDSAHAAYLERFFPHLRVACYKRPAVPLQSLKEGALDAVFGDALSLSFWLHGPQSEDCCRFSGGAYLDEAFFGAGLAIVMKSEDRSLKFAIDYALREIYRAGTYEELYLRYFPVSLF